MTEAWVSRDEYVQSLPKATVYACMYFTDASGQVLQLRSSYGVEQWQCPGGNMDGGETPWQTAVRETREETGLIITRQCPLLLTHFITPRKDWPHSHIGFIFDGGDSHRRAARRHCARPERTYGVEGAKPRRVEDGDDRAILHTFDGTRHCPPDRCRGIFGDSAGSLVGLGAPRLDQGFLFGALGRIRTCDRLLRRSFHLA
jgi:8-oxo-dGTP pyrophosphatase MutT (NUDIX family)